MPCCQSLPYHRTIIMLQLHSDRLLYYTYALLSVSITQQLSCYSYTLIDCCIIPMPCCQSLPYHRTIIMLQLHSDRLLYYTYALLSVSITQQLSCYSYTLTDCYIIPMPCCQCLLYHRTIIMLQLHSDRLLYHTYALLPVSTLSHNSYHVTVTL